MGVEVQQGVAFRVTADRHPPGIVREPVAGTRGSIGQIRQVAGFPDVVVIRVCIGVGRRDRAVVGAILTVGQLNRVHWTLNHCDL